MCFVCVFYCFSFLVVPFDVKEKLQAAVDAKRVKRIVSSDGSTEMYCFPKFAIGQREEYNHARQAGRQGPIEEETFEKLADIVVESKWTWNDALAMGDLPAIQDDNKKHQH